MTQLSRRGFIEGVSGLGLSLGLSSFAWAQARNPGAPEGWQFFNAREARFIELAIDRLIPPEPEWAGARLAGVANYIDLQLAGPFGQADRFFMGGPFKPGLPTQGYQMPHTPAELYRMALTALLDGEGRDFEAMPDPAKDAFLKRLEIGELDLGGIPSAVFFETLLTNTIEGYFADPSYGGNRDMVAWRMVGFPGAHAAYLGVYTQHGIRFDRAPIGMGGDGADHDHGHQHGHVQPAGRPVTPPRR